MSTHITLCEFIIYPTSASNTFRCFLHPFGCNTDGKSWAKKAMVMQSHATDGIFIPQTPIKQRRH